ncbi:DUF3037 domain-containing protein [soil metagenome]
MQEQHLFEYAVIRVVPRVEREEFINVGVVLYCASQIFLHTIYNLDVAKLQALYCNLDIDELHTYFDVFERICRGDKSAGPIAGLPAAERFRWLTAPRSTVLQTSKTHPGFCKEASEMLQRLYIQLVL